MGQPCEVLVLWWVFPKWAWSESHEQFLHCGLRKFRHSKWSVYRWYPQLACGRFVYDTYRTMEATRSRHGWMHMFITHSRTVTLQLHNFDFFRTCRTSSFCTVAWQLARFQLIRRIARSLGDSWASCLSARTIGSRHVILTAICNLSTMLVPFELYQTQLNSTENYGRRCLTPLSPHRNYILS